MFQDVLIIVLKSWENKIEMALENMAKRVPWKTGGFSYRMHTVNDNVTEDEGTATSLMKVAKLKQVN